MKRVLLLLPTTGYRNDDFLAAANKPGGSLNHLRRHVYRPPAVLPS
jgi:hypothetical protein